MKIVDHNDSMHSISLIPRFYPTTGITLDLYNEGTKVDTTSVVNTYSVTNGKLTINFTFTFLENERYQMKISESTSIAYRGKILVTDQEAQDYKLTDGLYFYE